MDEIDKKILDILRNDSRMNYVDIAKKVDLSEGSIRNRVEKLKDEGILKRFTIETGGDIEGIVIINAEPTQTTEAAEEIKKYAEKVYELSGEYDIIAWIHSYDLDKLNDKVDKIRETPGIINTETLIKLKEH